MRSTLMCGIHAIALLAVTAPLAAQWPFPGPRWPGEPPASSRRAIPDVSTDLQRLGVAAPRVDSVVRIGRDGGLEDRDLVDLLEDEKERILEGGPPAQFGFVVRGLVEQGLRGPALADAVRQERAARGHGPPAGRGGRPPGPPPGRGRGRR